MSDWQTASPTVIAHRLAQWAVPQVVCDEIRHRLNRVVYQEVEITSLRRELEQYRANEKPQPPVPRINNWTGD